MAQQQQSQGGSDNSMAPVWIIILLFITVFIVWKTGHQYIVSFVFTLNIWQAKLVNFFINSQDLASQINLMQTIDPVSVDWEQLVGITEDVGNYMRYPIVLVLIVLAVVLYSSNISLKFRKAHDMKSLRAQEQFNWPAIMPVVKEDLVSQDVNKGPWAMALTPMEFARKYNLLRKDDALLDNATPGLEMTAGI
ncbi:MAG: type IVB secretion system coupling complex protein DotM/IcmP, partial [Legionella sp.]